jgi:hypothetical protein
MDRRIEKLSQLAEEKELLEFKLEAVIMKIKKVEEDIRKTCYPHDWYTEREDGVYSQKYQICKRCQDIRL